MVRETKAPVPVDMTLDESPWHAKSLVVYLAALVGVIDVTIQSFVVREFWGTTTAIILAFFLCMEAYARLFRRKTYLGKTFAPVFSVIVIILIVTGYMINVA